MLQRWSKHMAKTLRANLRRGALFVLGGFAAIILAVSPAMTRDANAQIADFLSLGGSFTNGLSSCAIETVGWVICPTMRSIAKLADYGFTYMNENFLRIDYALAANDSGTYKAWEMMRTIANAAFVVAFMILVYSQISGRGSGGYSIKRLIPRLIIAAIAVNISYFLCVLFIDISNILGDSILFILNDQIANRVGTSVMPIGGNGGAFQDGTLTIITSSVLQKTGVAWVLLAPVAAVTISIATICAAMLILLIMRKTLVAMLILVSPLLFVAYLLPNLERLFSAGIRLFIQMLMLYPIIALLLGAGQIVSATIVRVGSNDANYRVANDFYFSMNGGSGSAITDTTAAAAAVVPLLGVWFLFKNMSSIMSMAGSRLSAAVRSRRGEDDKEARVTGKATAGARNMKQMFGSDMPNRRQAFSRSRRRRSLGGSSLFGEEGEAISQRIPRGVGPSMQGVLSAAEIERQRQSEEEAAKRREELEAARLRGDAEGLNLESLEAEAMAMAKQEGEQKAVVEKKEDKQVTAKDIFNQMNRQQGHDSKDKERKFSAGAPPAGSGGGSGGGGGSDGGSSQPSAPAINYKAPQIAQNANIITGSAPAQPTKIVAVPVQVDASSLLGKNPSASAPENMLQPPANEMQEKAKARAQKYLFDAERDLEEARNHDDILGKKHSNSNIINGSPNIPLHGHKKKDDGDGE